MNMTSTPSSPALTSTLLPADAVEVARIGAAWGVRGWFHVQPFSPDADALLTCRKWVIQPPVRGARHFDGSLALPVLQCRPHADGLVAHADGIASRDQAERIKGARVFISRAHFPPLEDGEFYWIDLMGCRVCNQQGVELGVVRELLPTGPQTTLVLEDTGQQPARQRLIPFVDAYVRQVNIQARCIEVDWQPEFDD